MKILLTLLFVIFALQAFGQPFGMGHPDGHFERPETGPTATPKEKIVGHCTVKPGQTNLIAQPCVSLLLTLTSQEGGEILNARTGSDGSFEFNVPANKKYKMGVSSRFYEVVSPLEDVSRGQDINLLLRQK